YGGTALALRLGHRQSIDFDFFSSASLDRTGLAAAIPFVAAAEVLQSEPDTLVVRIDRGGPVTVSFFGSLSFGQLAAPDLVADGIKIASPADLMATKLKAVVQRSESKDYIDIAALIKGGASLAEGLGGAVALFGPHFNAALPLKALTYFADGDLGTVPAEARQCLIEAVRETQRIPERKRHARIIGSLAPEID
ncbi:MAG: nucleotidyl transferase AbiEii/AbiGii toxin family protein, partial [Chthoniobacterales bacterium]